MANNYQTNETAFMSGAGPCYQPADGSRSYTRADFFALAKGDAVLATALFEQAAGETPELLLEKLWQAASAPLLPPLPMRALEEFQVLSDPQGRYYDSLSLDSILLGGGTTLAAALRDLLDGQFGCIGLHAGRPGIRYCKAYRIEHERTTDELAQGYALLPQEFPEVDIFVCPNSEAGLVMLCAWLEPGKLSPERIRCLLADLA